MPSTTLKELKNWVSEDSDWDTMTRRKLLEKILWASESIAMLGRSRNTLGTNTVPSYYFLLTVLGSVLPYCFFVPWVLQHGLNLSLMFTELFSTRIGAFFGIDVLISALTAIAFIRRDGAQRSMRYLWVPIAAICLVGVSCGLPLFLFMRERQLAERSAPSAL